MNDVNYIENYRIIYDLIKNNQHRKAVQQMLVFNMDEITYMLDYFCGNFEDQDAALDAAKAFFTFSGKQ